MIKPTKSTATAPLSIPQLADLPAADHPIIYVDGMSAMAIGPFVSKITLAIENHGKGARIPTVTIAIPTNALQLLAAQITNATADPAIRESMMATLRAIDLDIEKAGITK